MSNNRFNVADLDFEGIRSNLKEFLRGQDRFKDFDYEGSNMAVLLDLLAFNTHYNALYSNMAINELFLDTASKRSSVVSIAKTLGYTPKSVTSARVMISLTVTDVPGNPSFLTLPRYTQFYASKDGVRYTFNTVNEYSTGSLNGEYFFEEIELIEGSPNNSRFVVDNNTRFVLPNQNVDTNTLRVKVEQSETYKDYSFYVNADRESKIDGTKEVYFVKETFEGFTELVFGDGVFGKKLSNGNVVSVEYLISKGSSANFIKRGFTLSDQNSVPGNVSNIVVLSQDSGGTYGGAEKESIDEIRFNAPNLYASQGRAVTSNDYEALITEKVPTIDQCVAWGGEKNDPPVYGKVFICAKTVDERPLTLVEKETITREVIDPLKVVSVVTEFVDPTYISILLDARIYFDQQKTPGSDQDISTIAREVIANYSSGELERFNRVFRNSQLSRLIELADDSIVSKKKKKKIGFEIVPNFNVNYNYEFKTGNPLVEGTLSSAAFYMSAVVDTDSNYIPLYFDDALGVVNIYWIKDGVKTYYRNNVGSIDYSKGVLRLTNLKVFNATTQNLRFTVTPQSSDVVGFGSNILFIDQNSLRVASIRDETNERDASSYILTPNRT